jgi:hypothetical protein
VGKVFDDSSLPPAPAPSNTGGIDPHHRKDQREGKGRKEILYSDLFRVMSVGSTPPAEGGACSFAGSHVGGINPHHRKYAGGLGFHCTVSVLFCMTET